MNDSMHDGEERAVFVLIGGLLGMPFGPVGMFFGKLGGLAAHKWLNS